MSACPSEANDQHLLLETLMEMLKVLTTTLSAYCMFTVALCRFIILTIMSFLVVIHVLHTPHLKNAILLITMYFTLCFPISWNRGVTIYININIYIWVLYISYKYYIYHMYIYHIICLYINIQSVSKWQTFRQISVEFIITYFVVVFFGKHFLLTADEELNDRILSSAWLGREFCWRMDIFLVSLHMHTPPQRKYECLGCDASSSFGWLPREAPSSGCSYCLSLSSSFQRQTSLSKGRSGMKPIISVLENLWQQSSLSLQIVGQGKVVTAAWIS